MIKNDKIEIDNSSIRPFLYSSLFSLEIMTNRNKVE
jgi:hypothetical protein